MMTALTCLLAPGDVLLFATGQSVAGNILLLLQEIHGSLSHATDEVHMLPCTSRHTAQRVVPEHWADPPFPLDTFLKNGTTNVLSFANWADYRFLEFLINKDVELEI